MLFFIGTLFPALGFVNVFPFRYSFVADHFQYLASVGLIRSRRRWSESIASHCSGLLVVLLAALTWRQIAIYRDLPTLWQTIRSIRIPHRGWLRTISAWFCCEREKKAKRLLTCRKPWSWIEKTRFEQPQQFGLRPSRDGPRQPNRFLICKKPWSWIRIAPPSITTWAMHCCKVD